jgi:hypothetical protein
MADCLWHVIFDNAAVIIASVEAEVYIERSLDHSR